LAQQFTLVPRSAAHVMTEGRILSGAEAADEAVQAAAGEGGAEGGAGGAVAQLVPPQEGPRLSALLRPAPPSGTPLHLRVCSAASFD
jgi:hypothetical protein